MPRFVSINKVVVMKEQGCAQKQYQVSHQDLPLCCPLPAQRLWDAHPRVYLPIENTGQSVCPYCGAQYILTENSST